MSNNNTVTHFKIGQKVNNLFIYVCIHTYPSIHAFSQPASQPAIQEASQPAGQSASQPVASHPANDFKVYLNHLHACGNK